jgi:Ni/Co efflux regulator RcnB
MKFLPKIVLVLTAAASCAAGAASVLSPQADQERRDRNREEALAAYHASPASRGYSDDTTYRDDDSVTSKAKHAGHTVKMKTEQTTRPVRNFTHRQLNKMRAFSERQDERYGKPTTSAPNPHGDEMK